MREEYVSIPLERLPDKQDQGDHGAVQIVNNKLIPLKMFC